MTDTSARTRPDRGSYEDIEAAAVRTTGLTDFGGSDHEEGLRMLAQDLADNAGLKSSDYGVLQTGKKSQQPDV